MNQPIKINNLHWLEDADTPSTVDDSWPSEDNIIQTSPLRKNGQSAKIIAFAHEEFPLERPPINCRMLYDTVPITTSTTEQVEKNEPMYDYSCRMILSALSFPSSPRRHSYQTNKSSSIRSYQDNTDDQHEDILCGPKPNRFRSHTVTPLPLSMVTAPPNSLKTVKGVENFQQQSSPFMVHTTGASSPQEMVVQVPSSSVLQTHSPLPTLEHHHARASFVESFIASSSPSPEDEETDSTASHSSRNNKHMLSSFTSWWSSGSRVMPNAVNISSNNVAPPKHVVYDCHDPMTLSMRSETPTITPTITPFSTPSSSPNSSDVHLQGKYCDSTATMPHVDSTSDWLSHSQSRDNSDPSDNRSSIPHSPHPPRDSIRSTNSPRSHVHATTNPVAFGVPRGIPITLVPTVSDNLDNTAATMHAVRAWSSPGTSSPSSNNGGPPSPLLTVPVRVVRSIRSSSANQ